MMVQSEHILVKFTRNNSFINNSAIGGGVIYEHEDKFTTIGNVVPTFEDTNNLINNSANSKGGEIQAITTANAFFEVEICFY